MWSTKRLNLKERNATKRKSSREPPKPSCEGLTALALNLSMTAFVLGYSALLGVLLDGTTHTAVDPTIVTPSSNATIKSSMKSAPATTSPRKIAPKSTGLLGENHSVKVKVPVAQ
jgi:hypothetical protein